jgi:hypothetical protein
MVSSPSAATCTFMKRFSVVGIASGAMPKGARCSARLAKQLGCGAVLP